DKVTLRRNGKQFSLEEHIEGLVCAQLTNQTKWSRIVPHLDEIRKLFFNYDAKEIKKHPGSWFADGICALKCGNISIRAQMDSLGRNIALMESIVSEYGSMDAFVTSVPPVKLVKMLSSGKSEYKLEMLGEALAWEYIRNVGIDGCKPDTHLCRFLGNARMGSSSGPISTVSETVEQVEALSEETGLSLSSIDSIIWCYCADGFGEVCTASPDCSKCVVRSGCRNGECVSFSNEVLRKVCLDCGMDPASIGQYILDNLMF
ncbi:MAG: hypothetical protein ACI4NM_01675, partial [Bullifex sp.]